MKKVFLGLILAIAAMAQPLPNCFLNGALSAVGTSPILDNSLSQNECNTWVLTVFVPSTVSAYSVQLEGSGAGTFSAVIVSPSSGTNPCTTLTGCLIIFQGSYNQFRVNLTSLTGTGNVSYRLTGASGITAKSLNPLGAAGGDLSGSYPNPTVAKVNGNTPGGVCTSQFVRSVSSSAVPTCATVDNASLASPTITVNSTPCTLGGSCSISSGVTPQFSQSANTAVTGTTAFTTLLGTGSGSLTLPANFFSAAGSILSVDWQGVYTVTTSAASPSLQFTIGSATLWNNSVMGNILCGTNCSEPCSLHATITAQSVGTSGSVIVNFVGLCGTAASTTQAIGSTPTTSAVTLNTTISNTVNFLVSLGNSADTMTTTNFVLRSY